MDCYSDKLISLIIKDIYDKICDEVLGCDMLDLLTLNQRVGGSNPSAPTIVFKGLAEIVCTHIFSNSSNTHLRSLSFSSPRELDTRASPRTKGFALLNIVEQVL